MSAAKKPAPVPGLKVTAKRDDLHAALVLVSKVARRRNTVPILGNVKLSVVGEMLSLTGTDMDTTVSVKVPCELSPEDWFADGETTVDARGLAALVARFPSKSASVSNMPASVHFGDDGNWLNVSCGQRAAKMPTMPACDFPRSHPWEPTHRFTMPAADLSKLIDRTIFAVSKEETRYYLNGIYLHPTEKCAGQAMMLGAVATDGHHMAIQHVALPIGAADMAGVIVPRETVAVIRSAIEAAETVEITVAPTRIRVTIGDVSIEAKTIDGAFPDYGRVIPTDIPNVLRLPAKLLASTVLGVTAIGADRSRSVSLGLARGKVLVSHKDHNSGECSDLLLAEYDGSEMAIGFQARYLIAVAKILPAAVEVCMSGIMDPAIMRDPSDASALFIVMPMRL